MAMKKKTRARIARKATTEKDISNMVNSHGKDTLGSEKYTKSMFRAIFKFKRELNKVGERYSQTIPTEKLIKILKQELP